MILFDYITLALIAAGAAFGLRKGLISMVSGFFAVYLGLVLAHCFTDALCAVITPIANTDEKTVKAICFVILAVAAIVGAAFLATVLTRLIDAIALGPFNRIGGLLAGVLLTSLLISALLVAFENINSISPLVDTSTLDESVTYGPLKGLIGAILPFIR